MATPKRTDAEPLPAGNRPYPGPLPTDGDKVREVGKRAYDDVRGPKKDTDQTGLDSQRKRAPDGAPTRRSERTGGTDDR